MALIEPDTLSARFTDARPNPDHSIRSDAAWPGRRIQIHDLTQCDGLPDDPCSIHTI